MKSVSILTVPSLASHVASNPRACICMRISWRVNIQDFRAFPSYRHLEILGIAIANSDLFQCFFNIHTLCTVARPSSSQSGQSLQRQGSLHFAPGAPSTETDQYFFGHMLTACRTRNESFHEGNVQHRPTPGHGPLSQVRCSVRQWTTSPWFQRPQSMEAAEAMKYHPTRLKAA